MTINYYTGVGSRETPNYIQGIMTRIAKYLNDKDYVLRSGDAIGADLAFYTGATYNPNKLLRENPTVFKAKDCTKESYELVKSILDPNHWNNMNEFMRKLHGRNAMQVLGRNLDTPSKFVICWTLDGKLVGGTATAIKIANKFNIPVHNLGDRGLYKWYEEYDYEEDVDYFSVSSFVETITDPFYK